ncbi:MAG: hypothetical protein IPH07_25450 [Deltaproteobacteria bacterium]|nr:hypothetical protein [Deltaproteobacteria bacterium]MBP7288487.1 hypothetical protein [Nannocystaceae bacterium]
MAYAHRALEQQEAGPGVWRVVGPDAPAPLRGMVARGLAPLPPRDLLIALYQIWVSNDPDLATVASKTLEGLPPAILNGALDDATLPAGVLDLLGRKLPRNTDVLERVVRHRQVDDETLAGIARVCPDAVCDVLADNQERWMRHPAIVESLYQNPNCRMSVVHRMLEFAVRENIDVRLPNMDEIRTALLEESAPQPERDDLFKRATVGLQDTHAKVIETFQNAAVGDEVDLDAVRVEAGGSVDVLDLEAMFAQSAVDDLSLPMDEANLDLDLPLDEAVQQAAAAVAEKATGGQGLFFIISRMNPMEKMRMALLGGAFERFVLVRDSNKAVAMSAIKSPKVNDNEVMGYAANRTLARDVVTYISKRREWTKNYAITLNLVLNPKTPMATAMGFLVRLHPHDVKKVAFSKNIPSALATAARRKLEQRR